MKMEATEQRVLKIVNEIWHEVWRARPRVFIQAERGCIILILHIFNHYLDLAYVVSLLSNPVTTRPTRGHSSHSGHAGVCVTEEAGGKPVSLSVSGVSWSWSVDFLVSRGQNTEGKARKAAERRS